MILAPNNLSDLFAAPVEAQYTGVKAHSLYLTMRDGTQIAVDVMQPADPTPSAPVPTIMIMARYWRSLDLRVPDRPNKPLIGPREAIADYLLARGFAVVVVDARGTGASTGVNPYPWSADELADYAEVAAWVAEQPWSNGNIGTVGISYEGTTAQLLPASGVAGVRSAAPMEFEFDLYTDVAFPGGVYNEVFIRQWGDSNKLLDSNKVSNLFPFSARLFTKGVRPVDADRQSRTMLTQALNDHQANTDIHAAMSPITFRDDPFGETGVTLDDFSVFAHRTAIEASGAPLFIWGSWLDATTADTVIRSFNTLSNPQIGVIGAWKHEMTGSGSPYQGPKAKPNPTQDQQWASVAAFFGQTLVDGAPPTGKTLYYYTLGEETWKQTDQFPLPSTDMQPWYFQTQGALSSEPPPTEGTDTYKVDFEATTGRTNRWQTQMAQPLVYPDRAKEDRRVLTYTSAPLTQDMEITGYPSVTLHIASSAADGAFLVYLEDVDEKGVVRYVTEGQLRGIHRQLSDEPTPYWTGMPNRTYRRTDAAPLPEGEFVELVIGLQPTSVLIRRGHRIRIALAGADRETFGRIPTQGVPVWEVAHGPVRPSCVWLPVVGQ